MQKLTQNDLKLFIQSTVMIRPIPG